MFYLIFFISLFSFNYSMLAAEHDSVVKIFPEIQVIEKKEKSNEYIKFSSNATIDKIFIDKIGSVRISDALSFITGIFINSYGGIGGLQTISLRGTNSQQTLIMLEGIKLNSSQSGIRDISLMPASFIGNIEVIKGSSSGYYGGNSIGGAINLIHSPNLGNNINGKLSYGSFSEFNSSLGLNYEISPELKSSTNFDFKKSKGDYSFSSIQFGENKKYQRTNGDFQNIGISQIIELRTDSWNLKSISFLNSSERGSPGAVLQGFIENEKSRLNEKEFFTILKINKNISNNNFIDVSAAFKVNDLSFFNNDINILYNNANRLFWNSKDVNFNLKYNSYYDNFQFDFGFDSYYSVLSGDMLQKDVDNNIFRFGILPKLRVEYMFLISDNFFINYQSGFGLDFNKGYQPSFNPYLGFILNFVPYSLKLSTSLSSGFRLPSFNELYYFNYGTSNLLPEKSISLNTGVYWNYFEFFTCELSAFVISTKDQIVSIQKSPIVTSASNYGKVVSKGIESSVNLNIFNNLINLNLSYTYQSVINESENSVNKSKLVPYTPQEILSMAVFFNHDSLNFGSTMQYSSYRYSLPDNSYNSILPSYLIFNVFIIYNFNVFDSDFKFRADCNNLLDEQYSIIRNYPMPGRSFRFSLSFSII